MTAVLQDCHVGSSVLGQVASPQAQSNMERIWNLSITTCVPAFPVHVVIPAAETEVKASNAVTAKRASGLQRSEPDSSYVHNPMYSSGEPVPDRDTSLPQTSKAIA